MRIKIVLALAALIATLAVVASSASATAVWPQHRCGSFISEQTFSDGYTTRDRITVFNSRGLSCRLATAVIKAFWGPEDQIHHHGGHSDAESYYTTDEFPGWRCYQGAGAGSCRHRGKTAAYEAKNA